jgi:hypothetical protein
MYTPQCHKRRSDDKSFVPGEKVSRFGDIMRLLVLESNDVNYISNIISASIEKSIPREEEFNRFPAGSRFRLWSKQTECEFNEEILVRTGFPDGFKVLQAGFNLLSYGRVNALYSLQFSRTFNFFEKVIATMGEDEFSREFLLEHFEILAVTDELFQYRFPFALRHNVLEGRNTDSGTCPEITKPVGELL